jgi:hypothetical protein
VALSRQKKRVIAQLLVREAKRIAAEWDKKHRHADHGEDMSDVESSDVEATYASWLRHLPAEAWEKTEAPWVDDTAGHDSETYNTNAGNAQVTSSNFNTTGSTNTNSDAEAGASSGIADHENTAISTETPIMGDNDLHDEDEVLAVEDEDASGSEDPAQSGGPFRENP